MSAQETDATVAILNFNFTEELKGRVGSLYLSTCSTCIQKGKKLGVGTKKTERGLRSELLSRTPTNFWDKNGGNLHR